MGLVFGVEEKFEATGYDNTSTNSDDDWVEVVNAGCTLNEDSTGPASPPSWVENQCLYAEVDTDAGSNARAQWISASNQNDNFVRFILYVNQEGYNNNQLGYVCQLHDSTPDVAGGVQIGQSAGNLQIRAAYYDDSLKFGTLIDINSYLASNWLLIKYSYHDGSGGESKSWSINVDYWANNAWNDVGGNSGAITGTVRTPKAITAGLSTNQGTAQNTQVYIDRLWWDDAAFPINPLEIGISSLNLTLNAGF